MKPNKYLVAGALALAITAGSYGASTVFASSNNQFKGGDLVQRLVDHFNLNQDEVDQVVSQFRDEQQQEREQEVQANLSEAVQNGTITEEQKNLILQKHSEIQNKMEALRDSDPETRRTQMREVQDEMRQWAAENGIDMSFMRPEREDKGGMRMGDRDGDGQGMGRYNDDDSDDN